jgi:hypothetical protein
MSGEDGREDAAIPPLSLSPAERIAAAITARLHGMPWNPSEIVPAAIVTAVSLFALGAVIGTVVADLTGQGFGIAFSLLGATNWAGPVLAVALLGSVLLSWNEARGWCEDLELFAASDDDRSASEIDPCESVARVLRSRLLATCALILAVVTTAGSIATMVGAAMEQPGAFFAHDWGEFIASCGSALAVVALSVASLSIVLRIRRQVTTVLELSLTGLESDTETDAV